MDDFIEDAINGLSGHVGVLDALMKVSANDLVHLAPLLLLALWFWPAGRGERALNQRLAFAAAASIVVAVVMAAAVSHLHADTRPFVSDGSTRLLVQHAADNGFPSDHAAFSFAIGGALVWWRKTLGLVVLLFATVMGIARVYVGVHWPSDIVAGAAIGVACGLFLARLVPLLEAPQRWASGWLPEFLVSAA
jgi:undecaprenyl-diphosphatase